MKVSSPVCGSNKSGTASLESHKEEGSDEVYCQVLLVPKSEVRLIYGVNFTLVQFGLREGEIVADGEEEDTGAMVKSTTPHMFCKTLTTSNTSTHGGFSVPYRAAEDCFPPLEERDKTSEHGVKTQ
ncbi:hypothetical protein JHK87_024339 [Glycine soja]|nr:hypothetical protein JHK87_024339 [Glycine soja]